MRGEGKRLPYLGQLHLRARIRSGGCSAHRLSGNFLCFTAKGLDTLHIQTGHFGGKGSESAPTPRVGPFGKRLPDERPMSSSVPCLTATQPAGWFAPSPGLADRGRSAKSDEVNDCLCVGEIGDFLRRELQEGQGGRSAPGG